MKVTNVRSSWQSHLRHFFVGLVLLCRTSAFRPPPRCPAFAIRGGDQRHDDLLRDNTANNITVEEYVAAIEQWDAADTNHDTPAADAYQAHAQQHTTTTSSSTENFPEEVASVGVKSHGKRSNAVGDPDGQDSDDDDDDDDDSGLEDFLWDDGLDDLDLLNVSTSTNTVTTEVQVQVELMEQGSQEQPATTMFDDDEEDDSAAPLPSGRASGGGVGVRLGQRLARRRRKDKEQGDMAIRPALDRETVLQAWSSHVFLPPSSAVLNFLIDHARQIDANSKLRLDRRTLYAALVLEWHHKTLSFRKFLDSTTSQSLQAALSLASQPQWRNLLAEGSGGTTSGIRLYEDTAERGATLAMQETIAMALAHSMGAGLVIIDDAILLAIRKDLASHGYAEDDIKPAILLHHLVQGAREGQLAADKRKSLISKRMKQDLQSGLDDPFDERATSSVQDMVEWEEQWRQGGNESDTSSRPLPLILFLRAQSASSLLKSKSVVEILLQECKSDDGTNLVCIGKGIDARTTSLPQEPSDDPAAEHLTTKSSNLPGAAPWFGFSPHNQNASGQNDPDGSRRFNIFLARTVDPSGVPGILGAVAPPQAGNLFPHMMAMQARARLQMQPEANDSPVKAELERWAQLLQSQMQTNGGNPLPPPQFFNATLTSPFDGSGSLAAPPPPPEVIQRTLQHAMSELLDRLAQMSDDDDGAPSDLSPDLHQAFAQVLRNDNLRRGIADNLARAAPALSDPKCQGVMLSVYVPPPLEHTNHGKLPVQSGQPQSNMGGWFQKILHNQNDVSPDADESTRRNSRQKRVRTMAAAAAVLAAQNAQEKQDGEKENKADRNLARLEAVCRPIMVKSPSDPVRCKAWDAWVARERGSVVFRHNRQALVTQLEDHGLSLQEHTGTRGAGSALRQMLSVRDVSNDLDEVIRCAIELEAAKSQLLRTSPSELHERERDLDIDITLSQLVLTEDGLIENIESIASTLAKERSKSSGQYLHPSSLETALSMVCKISPSASGALSVPGSSASHRTRDEILALAQDKHERALVSQVVSPQDIGVTYDMIGGLTNVKELLRQSITYPLKFPHLYSEGIAREAVKGVLLFGPPGTGKTMLAKAVATEGGASFLSVDASSVENKWLGESEKNAKAVFTLARRLAPCVVFIDEVDSLLSSREGSSDDSAHGTLTSVKTTMMSEWDGLNSGTNGAGEAGSDRVIVIGSTNRPFDLDEAVLRRFPRRILVDLPDLETRTEILEVTLAENRLDPTVNLTKIAERLDGYTGSDIKEVCREAVVQISHEQAKLLDQGFLNTREDVTQGSLQRLRPVTVKDFENALSKLKRSVSEKGRELTRVWDWNDEYGEIKKEKSMHLPQLANMYL